MNEYTPAHENVNDPFEIDAPFYFALDSGGLSTSMYSIKVRPREAGSPRCRRALFSARCGPLTRPTGTSSLRRRRGGGEGGVRGPHRTRPAAAQQGVLRLGQVGRGVTRPATTRHCRS